MYGGGYPGPNCFRPISITYKGKTLPATIMDEVCDRLIVSRDLSLTPIAVVSRLPW